MKERKFFGLGLGFCFRVFVSDMFVWICSVFMESVFNVHLCDMKVAPAYRCCAFCVQRHACMNNNDVYMFFVQ